MVESNLGLSLIDYQAALAKLGPPEPLEPEQLLAALTARDALARALAKSPPSPKSLLLIAELDEKLKALDARIVAKAIPLADWRASYPPPDKAWWWTLDALKPPGQADRCDWLWNAFAALFFLGTLSVVTEIAGRFVRGGPDVWGALTVLAQAALTLLAAGGALTKAGQTAMGRILGRLRVPGRFRQEWRAAIAFVLLALMVGAWFLLLPTVARAYNNAGLARLQHGQLLGAQHRLQRAVNLQPDYANAHYNLGLVYEALLEYDQAQTEYQIAVRGGLVEASNNLARLYVLQGQPSEAVYLLQEGLASPTVRSVSTGETDEAVQAAAQVRYSMLKNLGWARLLQERYDEASAVLSEAISLDPEPAAAHCLLAQALAGRGELEGAASSCEDCLVRARSRASTEEDQWIGACRQTLNPRTQGGTP